MRVLVTGAAGFIGRRVCASGPPELDVVAVVRPGGEVPDALGGAEVVEADLSDPGCLAACPRRRGHPPGPGRNRGGGGAGRPGALRRHRRRDDSAARTRTCRRRRTIPAGFDGHRLRALGRAARRGRAAGHLRPLSRREAQRGAAPPVLRRRALGPGPAHLHPLRAGSARSPHRPADRAGAQGRSRPGRGGAGAAAEPDSRRRHRRRDPRRARARCEGPRLRPGQRRRGRGARHPRDRSARSAWRWVVSR